LADLLAISGLARSTYYYQLGRLRAAPGETRLKALIRKLFDRHKGRYGYRRITAALRRIGEAVNHKRVQRLMQQMQLKSVVRPKRYRAYRGAVGLAAPNLLQRDFSSKRPRQKWVTDVTEFKVGEKKLYLSAVLDLFNGEVVAWKTAERATQALTEGMLDQALKQVGKCFTGRPALILHSDQGWHYQMRPWQHKLASSGVRQSMSRKGNCLDNAAMESFFAVLKTEMFYTTRYSSVEQLRRAINRYMRYYNEERIKMALNGLSPVEYRAQWEAA